MDKECYFLTGPTGDLAVISTRRYLAKFEPIVVGTEEELVNIAYLLGFEKAYIKKHVVDQWEDWYEYYIKK